MDVIRQKSMEPITCSESSRLQNINEEAPLFIQPPTAIYSSKWGVKPPEREQRACGIKLCGLHCAIVEARP